ncbi:Nucleoside diphosphate kinase [Psidium guajava]|nr:Nucleoside diphosphate kinase [Psidium guajava]
MTSSLFHCFVCGRGQGRDGHDDSINSSSTDRNAGLSLSGDCFACRQPR